MKKILFNVFLLLQIIASCSSSTTKNADATKDSSVAEQNNINSSTHVENIVSTFSAQDSFVHLKNSEFDQDPLVKDCKKGKFDEVSKTIFNLIKNQKEVLPNTYRLAVCYSVNQNYSKAYFYWNKVYAASKDAHLKAKSLSNMSLVQWEWHKYRKAINYQREAAKIAPLPVIIFNIARMELALHLFTQMDIRYQQLKQIDSSDPYLTLILAEMAMQLSYFDEAVGYYKNVGEDLLELRPVAVVNYVIALLRTNKIEQLKDTIDLYQQHLDASEYYTQTKKNYPELKKYE